MSSDSSTASPDVQGFFGLSPLSAKLVGYLLALLDLAETSYKEPEVKSYSDAIYFNYYPLGMSLLFKPVNGYKPKTGLEWHELDHDNMALDGIDIYNIVKSEDGPPARQSKSAYASYPSDTLTLSLAPTTDKTRPESMILKPNTTGKEFVACMGEPDRKGGGAGPSTGSIGIWCEWSKDGVMVEFGGDESRGPKAWETGKDAIWKVISVFPPKTS